MAFSGVFAYQDVVNALEGVCYMTDADGLILAVGEPHWTEFARQNGGGTLEPGSILGRNLFDFISGEDVADSYRTIYQDLVNGIEEHVSFTYRCDAPDVKRELRMCMSAVKSGGETHAITYQSLSLREDARPPISLFDVTDLARYRTDMSLPMATLCSYCHAVKSPGEKDLWVTPEAYYASGGTSQVRLSHGICPDCYESKVRANRPGHSQ